MAIYKLQRIFSNQYLLRSKLFARAIAKGVAMAENIARLEKAGKAAEAATARAEMEAHKAYMAKQAAEGKKIAQQKKIIRDNNNIIDNRQKALQNGEISGYFGKRTAEKDISTAVTSNTKAQESLSNSLQKIQQNRGMAHSTPFDAAGGESDLMKKLKNEAGTYKAEKEGFVKDELSRRGLEATNENKAMIGGEYKDLYRGTRNLNTTTNSGTTIQNIAPAPGQKFTFKEQPKVQNTTPKEQPKTSTTNNNTTNTTTNSTDGNWWNKQSTTTKGLIIGGGALTAGVGGGALISNMGNNNNQRAFSYKEYIKTLLN